MSDKVQGRCPQCNRASLFLGSGGYVTCSIAECTNPTLASDFLEMGRRLNDLAWSGAQVHHIAALQDQVRELIATEPFTESFSAFLAKLVVGRDPQGNDGESA